MTQPKLASFDFARRLLLALKEPEGASPSDKLQRSLATVDALIDREKARTRKWVAHDGPMPIGPPPGDAPSPSFGDTIEITASRGDALMAHGEMELAITHYRTVLQDDPEHLRVLGNLGAALYNLERYEEAEEYSRRSLDLDPDDASAHWTLGRIAVARGQHDAAVEHLREAVLLSGENVSIAREFCAAVTARVWQLAADPDPALRNGTRAVTLAEEVCRLPKYVDVKALDALAAAYAEAGRYEDAATVANRALALARQNDHADADAIAQRLAAYQEERPWRTK